MLRILLVSSFVAVALVQRAFAYDIAITEAFAKPMTLSLESDYAQSPALIFPEANSIYLTGELDPAASTRFVDFLKAHSPVPGTTVYLYSPGGNVEAGLTIGRWIRYYKLRTAVKRRNGTSEQLSSPLLAESECDSACTLAFMGGVQREVPDGSNYGVHDANIGDNSGMMGAFELGQTLLAEIASYCKEMGVSTDFVNTFVKYYSINNEIYYMPRSEMKALNIVTDDYETSWSVESYFTPGSFDLVARTPSLTKFGKNNLFVVSCSLAKQPLLNIIMTYPSTVLSPKLIVDHDTVTNAAEIIKNLDLVSVDANGKQVASPRDVSAADINPKVRYLSLDGYLRMIVTPGPSTLDYIEKSALLEVRLNMTSDFYSSEGYVFELKDRSKLIADMSGACKNTAP